MLTKFHVENFKNLADVTAEFGPVNAVIGPNGCGKSSLLQAIDFLRAFFSPSIEHYLGENDFEYSDLPNLRQKGKEIRWELEADLGDDESGNGGGKYEYVVTARRWRYLGVGEERLTYTAPGQDSRVLVERSGRSLARFAGEDARGVLASRIPRSLMADMDTKLKSKCPEMFRFRDWVAGFRSFLLWDPKVLRKPDRGKHLELGRSGEHLAPVLAVMKKQQPEAFARLARHVKRLFPTVGNIAVKGGKGWGWQKIVLVEGDVEFNSEQMSDGVLRLLSVLTFLYSRSAPSLIAFEEPENGMHPQLVSEVVQILGELAQRKPPNRCQVFFTTHSPYVLDEFRHRPEQVYVIERGRPLEGARLTRLSERKDISLVQATFDKSLGEAWFSGLIGGASGRR